MAYNNSIAFSPILEGFKRLIDLFAKSSVDFHGHKLRQIEATISKLPEKNFRNKY